MKTFYLIGGGPTAGKSFMANELSKKKNLPWLSTDQVRNLMRLTTTPEKHPKLFNPSGCVGVDSLLKFSTKELVQIEIDQAIATWEGIKYLVEEDYSFERGFILEGVNILPELVHQSYKNNGNVKPIFLIENNPDNVKEVILNRGLTLMPDEYNDDLVLKDLQWTTQFSNYVVDQARKYNYPVLEVNKHPKDIETVISLLE
jgi:2-phosphoglycerate kinase